MIEHVLIDADIVAYRCSAATENDAEDIAHWQASEMVRRIVHETNAMQYHLYLTGSDNFRYSVYPDYKANRKDVPKPTWLQSVRAHLVTEWGAKVINGIEADDQLGIDQMMYDGTSIIASIDKDLLMIPGFHYNFVKQEMRTVSPLEGLRHFYTQLIMGDRSDNIPGYDGKMRVKVPKFLEADVAYLEECMSESEMFEHVASMYDAGIGREQLVINGKLLWIMRKENDHWNPPPKSLTENIMVEHGLQLGSMPS